MAALVGHLDQKFRHPAYFAPENSVFSLASVLCCRPHNNLRRYFSTATELALNDFYSRRRCEAELLVGDAHVLCLSVQTVFRCRTVFLIHYDPADLPLRRDLQQYLADPLKMFRHAS